MEELQQKEHWCAAVEKRGEPGYWNRLDRDTETCSDEGMVLMVDEAVQTAIPGCSRKRIALLGCGTGHWSNSKRRKLVIKVLIALTFLIIIIVAIAAFLAVEKCKRLLAAPGPPAGPCCPDGWVGYRGKCYYFSETEGNWTYSQSQCSALNASLAAIDSEQEKDFLLRYKGLLDRWIGLQREPGQPWMWPNGTEFDQRFPIRGGGDCVFLMDEDWFGSSRCSTWRRWICSKPDPCTMGKGRAVESKLGDS
ncbi:C-type lectin domain family 2 member D [Chelydra serpentina]|uniref:C-type lectin domain family 2 member D n=1 Tax=Chelydra serpentina TaxID=8475 RepID=A0A8T1S4B6_CHESE|nr:C-type lectin domain family 2 member D [Chelydra serpentina]